MIPENRKTANELISTTYAHPSSDDPCKTCHYSTQACAYILDGKNIEDACIDKKRWLKHPLHNHVKECNAAVCKDLELENEDLRWERDWYKQRCNSLQCLQATMREPERTLVCDILANGHILSDPYGNRYGEGKQQTELKTGTQVIEIECQRCGHVAKTFNMNSYNTALTQQAKNRVLDELIDWCKWDDPVTATMGTRSRTWWHRRFKEKCESLKDEK
jgi:hypothetical protein